MTKVQIRGSDAKLTGDLRAHVERHLGLALGRFAGRIGSVIVRFTETDGNKCCQIDVGLRPRKVRVEDTNADSFAAVSHAAARLSSSIDRALERERQWEDGGAWPRIPIGAKP